MAVMDFDRTAVEHMVHEIKTINDLIVSNSIHQYSVVQLYIFYICHSNFEMSQFLPNPHPGQGGADLTLELIIKGRSEASYYDNPLRLTVTSSIVPPSFGLRQLARQAGRSGKFLIIMSN